MKKEMTMKRTIKRRLRHGLGAGLFLCALAVVLLGGCSKDEPDGPDDGGLVAVEFTALMQGTATPHGRSMTLNSNSTNYTGVTTAGVPYRDFTDTDGFATRAFYVEDHSSFPATRTTNGGNDWTSTDEVGMFMVNPGTITAVTAGGTTADNIAYAAAPGTPASLATFSPATGSPTIYYPQDGSPVDFIAYYPYASGAGTNPGEIDNNVYHLTIAGQTSEDEQNKLDVLFAKATNVAKSKNPVALTFGHVLSKVTLNVTAGDGIDAADVQAMAASAVVFKGMPQTAEMALQDGTLTAGAMGDFNPLKGTASGGVHATFTALVVPQPQDNGTTSTGLPNLTDRTVIFSVGGLTLTWPVDDAESFEAGQHYTYPVTVTRHGITVGSPTINKWNENDNPDGSGEAEILAVRVKAGTFLMGSPDGSGGINGSVSEPNRQSNETLHEVTLTKDFYMGKYPVTNAEYAAYLNARKVQYETGISNSWISGNGGKCTWGDYSGEIMILVHNWGVQWDTDKWVPASGYERYPVINVTWFGAYEYAEWLSRTTGLTWRLPTEAEWEYACRGGQSESLPFGIGDGTMLYAEMANFYGTYPYDMVYGGQRNNFDGSAGHSNTIINSTSTVDSYDYPNGFGLYDMHGNVWEWCSDWYGSYGNGPDTDPTGPVSGYYRVLRGGSWGSNAQYCRSAYRNFSNPDYANGIYGFRVVFVP